MPKNGFIPVTVINTSGSPHFLHKGTRIGQVRIFPENLLAHIKTVCNSKKKPETKMVIKDFFETIELDSQHVNHEHKKTFSEL